jgi:hypothetical protein
MVPCYCNAHALPTLLNVCELSKSLPFLPYTLKGAPLPSLEKKLRKKFQKNMREIETKQSYDLKQYPLETRIYFAI